MTAISPEQLAFLKEQKRKQSLILFFRIDLLIVFLALWELAALRGWIDSFIFSSPSHMIQTFFTLYQKNHLPLHIGTTLLETCISFLLVIFLSLAISILLWLLPGISSILEPYLVVLNSLPKSALAPLLIVWLGANVRTIITAGVSVAIFGSIINLYTGFQEADPEKLKLISTLGGGKKEQLLHIILPSSVSLILSNMKVNIGLCLVGVVIGEFIGARQGLGYLIIYGSQVFKLDWVILSILLLCAMAMGLYFLLDLTERFIMGNTGKQ